MTKFMANNMVFTFGGTAIDCIASVDVNETISNQQLECGTAHMTTVTGLKDTTITLNLFLDDDDANTGGTLLTLARGETGAVVFQPNGDAGGLQYDAAVATVTDVQQSFSKTAASAATITIKPNDWALSHDTT